MLKGLKEKLHKTKESNTSTILRKLDRIDEDVLLSLLSSDLLGEGVYSFEIIANEDDTEFTLSTPSCYREMVHMEVYRSYSNILNELDRLTCYNITLTKPTFLPLYTKEPYSLLQSLSLLQSKNNEIFVQLLFTKRNDQWQEQMINLYESYLKGNDYPSASSAGRKVQHSMLKVISKIGSFNFKRKEIEEINRKILEDGYRFELRLMVYGEKGEYFEQELNEILKEMNYFNEFRYEMVKKRKKEFVDDYLQRKFSPLSQESMISESELICICTDDMEIKQNRFHTEEKIEKALKQTVSISHSSDYSLVDLLPEGKKKEREVDNEIIAQLPSALNKARAIKTDKLDILNVELGATVQSVTFKIPKGGVYSEIKGKYEDIKSSLGTDLSITQGKEPDTVTFLIPCSEREVIYLRDALQNPEFIEFAKNNPLPFICGIDMNNKPVYKCLTQAPHLLIAGATNSGKSVFMNSLLITLILFKSPSELRLFLIDPKQVELTLYEDYSHVERLILDMSHAELVFETIVNEMEKRYTTFSKAKVKNIAAYNKKVKEKMSYIVCAIDEYNDLKMVYPEVEEYIERLGQKARGAGIHLILATQRPDKNVLSGVIKSNFPSRICFSLNATSEYMTVYGTGIPYKNLLGKGDGVVKYLGQTEDFIRFQAPVISLDSEEEEKVFENIKKAISGEKVESIEVIEVIEEDPIEKLKRIVLETGETRVKELQKEMGIGINKVSEMMKQLVDEGFWKKENNRYVVIEEGESVSGNTESLLQEASDFVIDTQSASVSMLQRKFKLGYSEATKIIDEMEEMGIVGKFNGSRPRDVLIKK